MKNKIDPVSASTDIGDHVAQVEAADIGGATVGSAESLVVCIITLVVVDSGVLDVGVCEGKVGDVDPLRTDSEERYVRIYLISQYALA